MKIVTIILKKLASMTHKELHQCSSIPTRMKTLKKKKFRKLVRKIVNYYNFKSFKVYLCFSKCSCNTIS